MHAVARNRLGQVIATGRLVPGAPGSGRIGRMAVHRVLRGGGHGAAVLRALEEAARARGDREVALHAQRSAEAFYTRPGLSCRTASPSRKRASRTSRCGKDPLRP